jgi:hypothetical protein
MMAIYRAGEMHGAKPIRNRDAFSLATGDRVRLHARALSARRLGAGTVFVVRKVDRPRYSPWIDTMCGARLAPWEVERVP